MKQCTTVELFDLNHTIAKPLLERCQYPWQALDKIEEFLLYVIEQLPHQEYKEIAPQVWAHHSAVVAATAIPDRALYHWPRCRNSSLCLCARKCPHWSTSSGRQFHRVEKLHSF